MCNRQKQTRLGWKTINSGQNKGFSLIELLVVLVIIGLMAVLVPPSLSGAMQTMKAKASAREVISALRETRNTAINSQEAKLFTVDLKDKSISVDNQLKTNLPENMHISLFTAKSEQLSETKGAIRFFQDGSSTGGRIKLAMGKQNLYVDVNWLTGRVVLLENVDPKERNSERSDFEAIN